MAHAWQCPFCNRATTVGNDNVTAYALQIDDDNKDGLLVFEVETITCPNPNCKEYAITTHLHKGQWNNGIALKGDHMTTWQLRPNSNARHFPDYIPAPLLADYTEACLIRDLSPKASATLARRCLQGMIRDFWNEPGHKTLFQEINAIKDRVDPAIWNAIDAVRKIGNIGAHMENDINLVIDVDPGEAQMLIRLIEVLFAEWYVARQHRAEHLAGIVALASAKKP